ncbi:hypothetical protein ACQPZA_24110 [Pseudonocardia xinjiangensis]|uniref:hypothetical protein n=1 Tax=Pseudonocardia xinjiangensis TaxID=75289 RepID=UPI003D8BF86E
MQNWRCKGQQLDGPLSQHFRRHNRSAGSPARDWRWIEKGSGIGLITNSPATVPERQRGDRRRLGWHRPGCWLRPGPGLSGPGTTIGITWPTGTARVDGADKAPPGAVDDHAAGRAGGTADGE